MNKDIFSLDDMQEFIKYFVIQMQSDGYSAWYIAKVLAFVLYSVDFDIK